MKKVIFSIMIGDDPSYKYAHLTFEGYAKKIKIEPLFKITNNSMITLLPGLQKNGNPGKPIFNLHYTN